MVVLECVNLALLDSTEACQLCNTNESYWIGDNITEAHITLHCLALWSYLET